MSMRPKDFEPQHVHHTPIFILFPPKSSPLSSSSAPSSKGKHPGGGCRQDTRSQLPGRLLAGALSVFKMSQQASQPASPLLLLQFNVFVLSKSCLVSTEGTGKKMEKMMIW
jgi:hypothetical protein